MTTAAELLFTPYEVRRRAGRGWSSEIGGEIVRIHGSDIEVDRIYR